MIESPALQKLCAATAPFFWNEDLQMELDAMKAALRQHIKLSPLDTSKDLLVWTNAAPSEGMAYVLAQWKDPDDENESLGINIVSCDSTMFKRGKRSLSPFEAELAGVHWALTKEDYFTRGAPKITVMCDTKSMAGFLSQELEKIDNSRAQSMVEELQPYRIEVRYVPGPKMEFADYGSRHPISHGQHKLFDTEPGSLGICVRSNRVVPMVETLAVMAVRDPGYMRDVEHIERQADLDQLEKTSELRQLRSCWDQLSVISLDRGKLIVRGDREILKPSYGRKQLVDQLHTTHLSYQGMRYLARNNSSILFWFHFIIFTGESLFSL